MMNFEEHLESLIPALSNLKLNPAAEVMYDCMSGGLVWDDEKVFAGLSVEQMGCLRAIFCYRTSIISGSPDSRFEILWNNLQKNCPQWIGFKPSRCTPSPHLRKTLELLKDNPVYPKK